MYHQLMRRTLKQISLCLENKKVLGINGALSRWLTPYMEPDVLQLLLAVEKENVTNSEIAENVSTDWTVSLTQYNHVARKASVLTGSVRHTPAN